MAARYEDFYLDQGADWSQVINLQDDSTHSYINIATRTYEANIKRSTIITNVAETILCTVGNTGNGQLVLSLGSSNTSNLSGTYLYWLYENIPSPASRNRILQGRLFVNAGG